MRSLLSSIPLILFFGFPYTISSVTRGTYHEKSNQKAYYAAARGAGPRAATGGRSACGQEFQHGPGMHSRHLSLLAD